MNRRPHYRLFALACAATISGSHPRAAADFVIQTNGKIVVGHVTQEDQPEVRIATGTPQGPREVVLPRSNIDRLLRGVEEMRQIDGCNDAKLLAQWTAGYYFGGMETSATRCLERAIALDASLAAKPMAAVKPADSPAAKFVTFWNRNTLRRLTSSIPKGNTRRMLEVARWAKAAGRADTAAFYLRRAWNANPGDEAIKRLAGQWKVALESWVQVDLTPALVASLFSNEIVDENERVRAESGKVFLTLPIRYEIPRATGSTEPSVPPSISRTTLVGKDVRGFYGLRNTPVVDGHIRLEGLEPDPVFEQLDSLAGEENAGLVVLRNKYAPRRVTGDDPQRLVKPRQDKLRDEPRTIRSTGAAAILLEISETAERLSFEWPSGVQESIDLAYLRRIRDIAMDKAPPQPPKKDPAWTSVPAVGDALAQLRGPSGAMAALAIERLARFRDRLVAETDKLETDEDLLPAWSSDVDSAIIAAAARDEERVRVAAWRYFCTSLAGQTFSPLPGETLDQFADAEPDVQLRWIQLVACGLRVEDGGLWWRQTAGIEPRPADNVSPEADVAVIDRSRAVALVGALLRSEDGAVTWEAMKLLTALKPPLTDWGFLEEASIVGQRSALAHVGDLGDRRIAAPLIQALILSARPETASEIAEAARASEVADENPNDLLLAQWWSLHGRSRKTAFLDALCGIDLGNGVYGWRFSEFIKDAVTNSGAQRDAAYRLLIAQLRHRRDHVEAAREGATLAHGPFPLILARSANDPLTRGVIAATHAGSPAVRVEALQALIESGYAGRAAVCLMDSYPAHDEREAVLDELIPLAANGHRDAVLALLGALLNKRCETSAGRILDQLSRAIASVDHAEQWRVFAAVKAGAHLVELDEIGLRLGPPTANAVLRWLHALGHMSPQDRQRLAASRDPAERGQRLAQINFRRGQLVDGRYGVLAVVSTSRRSAVADRQREAVATDGVQVDESRAAADPQDLAVPGRWGPPKQITLALDPLVLETRVDEDVFKVRWGDRVVGEGVILQQIQPIRGPAAYLPAIETGGSWGPPSARGGAAQELTGDTKDEAAEAARPVGPLRLPHRTPLERNAPGTMTLDITAYLAAGLKGQRVFDDEDLAGMVPDAYKITLRYGVFGSFYGCGPRRLPWTKESMLPASAPSSPPPRHPGSHFLLNVMLVVERME